MASSVFYVNAFESESARTKSSTQQSSINKFMYTGVEYLGFLLVLDQTEIRRSGTPHFSTLVHPLRLVREGEIDPRWIVIVKVPGRRVTPSQLSK